MTVVSSYHSYSVALYIVQALRKQFLLRLRTLLHTPHNMANPVGPPPYKIVLLGESSVGKTSLVHRFTTDTFDQHTANTIGAAFITKEYCSSKPQSLPANRNLKFEIWDTAGQERYRSLTPMYYRNAKAALVCYDMSNMEETFEKAKYWIEQLSLNRETTADDPIRIVVIGNKRDLAEEPDVAVVEDFCRARKIKAYQTSSKTGSGISDIFDDIVDGIPDTFFETYYKDQAEAPHGHNQLNFLNTAINNRLGACC